MNPFHVIHQGMSCLRGRAAVFLFVCGAAISASPPAWWAPHAVTSTQPGALVDDYSAANLGQLKTIAKKAKDALDQTLPDGAGPDVSGLISGFQAGSLAGHDDYAVVNVGQAKSVASKFYDRLGLPYPWPASPSANSDDYALINIGQLKTLFAFDIPLQTDSDGDGILDSWEMSHFGVLDHNMALDTDGDGLIDLYEGFYRSIPVNGTNTPSWEDSDADGVSDYMDPRPMDASVSLFTVTIETPGETPP